VKPSARRVLDYLQTHDGVTELEAVHAHLGTRLSGRIFELKAAGYPIVDEWESYGDSRYKRYRLVREPMQLVAGL
jgi:hypothetical protein